MLNPILNIGAILLLILGVVSMLTPIPGGVLFIAGGLTALICTSPRLRLCIKYFRTKVNWINKVFFFFERKVGSRIAIIGNALKMTRPSSEEIV